MVGMETRLESVLPSTTGELVLRICGTPRAGQVVRIRAAKCSVGSGANCTLRLQARGVHLLHCLILRTSHGAAVRCWSGDTRLNGRPFTDSRLEQGDCLSIGPIDLEILDTDRDPSIADDWTPQQSVLLPRIVHAGAATRKLEPPQPVPLQPDPDELHRLARKLRRARRKIAQLRRQPPASPAQREDCPDPTKGMADLELAREALERDRKDWQRDQAEAEKRIEQKAAELRTRRAALDQRSEEFDEELTRLEALRQEHQAQAIQFQGQRAALEGVLARWSAQWADTHFRLDERQQEIEARETTLRHQRENLDQQRAEQLAEFEGREAELARREAAWREQHDALETQLRQREAQLDARQAELGRNEETLTQPVGCSDAEEHAKTGCRLLEQTLTEPVPCSDGSSSRRWWQNSSPSEPDTDGEASTPPDGAPRDGDGAPIELAAILRRLGRRIPESDEPQEASPDLEKPAPSGDAPSLLHREEDEESIDDYMARLLERVNGKPSDAAMPRTPATRPSRPEPQPALEEPEAPEPEQPSGSRRRARVVPPEHSMNLPAMRELANFSANSAIHRHTLQRLRRSINDRLVLACTAAGLAAGMLWFWRCHAPSVSVLSTVIGAFALAALWGGQYLVLHVRTFQKRRTPGHSRVALASDSAAVGPHETLVGMPISDGMPSSDGGSLPSGDPD